MRFSFIIQALFCLVIKALEERAAMAKPGHAILGLRVFFLAVFCLNLLCAQAQRQLAPGPYSEEEQEIQRCLDLTTSAGKQNKNEG
jgi:hypothetical protein